MSATAEPKPKMVQGEYTPPEPDSDWEFISVKFEKGLLSEGEQLIATAVGHEIVTMLIDNHLHPTYVGTKGQLDIRFKRGLPNTLKFTVDVKLFYGPLPVEENPNDGQ